MIRKLIRQGALFVSNHSGGKDSQVMHHRLSKIIPFDQLIIVHSHLPEVEWEGSVEHINRTANGTPVFVVQANKTFFEMVEHRKMFPSPKNRQCTSDLKRGPIQKFINNYAKENGFKIVVNCLGLRAEESSGRKKKLRFQFKADNSAKHRQQYEWLPIHSKSTEWVFKTIEKSGFKPFWTYAEGMERKSCSFCIMGCESDLKIAARLRPDLLERYSEVEQRLKFNLIMPTKKNGNRTLKQIVNE